MADDGSLRRPHRGLRFRVTLAFAVGNLVLVGVLALATYLFAAHYLVRQRERSLTRQAFADARVLRDEIQREEEMNAALESLDRAEGSNVVVGVGDRWYGTSVAAGRDDLPRSLQEAVESGQPAHQRIRTDGHPTFAVGLPLTGVDAHYYELFSLSELDRTLRTIRTALVAGGALAVVLGSFVGLWLSRRALRPVAEFAAGAERVAAGDLATRLPPNDDPDLESLATSFNRMVDAVEQRIERESRFVSDVSHELRSPLTTLAMATQVMGTRRDVLPDRAAKAFDLLEAEVARLQQMVEDLLELGRADAGAADLRLEPVRLDELVHHVVDREHAEPLVLEVDEALHDESVTLDKRRLERVLSNLVHNAETHGGGLRRVVVRKGDGLLRVEIEDAGPGIPHDERASVFRRFYRGAAAGRRASGSGSGLGLALVAEQVRMHGGRVWVEDPDGPGARFVFELPDGR
jgi:signal transduction histidine kinase